MKLDKETEDGKKRGDSVERSKTGRKNGSPDCLTLPNLNMIPIHNMYGIIL